jgi:DNA-binding protein HU-beta
VNKGELIDELESRLGGRKAAAEAVQGVLDVIIRTVARGEKVGITGFGTFEKALRAARIGRNPRTGASVKIKKTAVPKFKAGTQFRDVVADPKKLPPKTSAAGARASASTSAASSKTAVKKATVKKAASAKKAAPAKKTAVKKTAPAKKTAVKATAVKKTAVKKTAPAKKVVAKKTAPAKKVVAKKTAPAKKTAATKRSQ